MPENYTGHFSPYIKNFSEYKEYMLTLLVRISVAVKTKINAFTFSSDSGILANLIFGLISIITIPFTLLFIAFCLVEIALYTVLLPLYLIPYVRIIPTLVMLPTYLIHGILAIFAGTSFLCEPRDDWHTPIR